MGFRIVKLPDIGEGVAEAEVSAWHVKVGDVVREDQPLADVMTDKATVEIPSPVSGTVAALGAEAGQMLAVGAELVRLEVEGGDSAPAAPPGSGVAVAPEVARAQDAAAGKPSAALVPAADGLEPAQPAPTPPSASAPKPAELPKPAPAKPAAPVAPRAAAAAPASGPPRPPGEKPIASPAVRRRALDAGIDLRQVRGTGPAGRIGHDDLDAFLDAPPEEAAPAPAGRAPRTAVEEIKVIGLRRRIAQRMADAKRRVAHFSYVEEVDVTALEELRASLNQRHGAIRPKLTLIPFLVQALVRALPDFPQMNAHYDDEAEVIHRHAGVHVGIATQTPSGLMVPVLRHAETRDLWNAAAEVRRLAEAARNGLAARDELSGSTITITSLGALGGIVTTPVINRPEVAIIGVNKQVMRPVWRDGAFVPRLTMNLSASFDHRVVDGYDAALFVQALKALLETPAMLFMEA
ncbi:dihydrolipoamide acetyltransferase family protein [Methylobacterium frigidaeris]|uniref:Dihydrolipoamide acetyltransferase component of pyruvate dehydrogenase complex n=1 Tax=Methylobacterium frigidaeris TaxID=2038277 RepID=A0AA37M6Q6_9HYPH|nr:dihydrolipoamide acetyltransferase family protein [Methylobacterium frigidaeris]PIK69642.1 branched-chain alpha-keto acid dehydrogenase subunit E2 [Methylobacterium frigidaeris]GJD64567.1 Lipoamide acyltransferase component of branched-chain alpha-keto acid dehydrogenase complex [Methylobacterium frigidaeris]